MKKPLKQPPVLRTEEKARDFWGACGRDSTEYLDWGSGRAARFSAIRLSTKTISLRLPEGLLERIKLEANKRDVTYQSLIKVLLADAVARMRREAIASRFIGSDKRPGDVARHSKQLLRDRHRAK